MENTPSEFTAEASIDNHPRISLISNFCEITACASQSEALFFLESHNFDLDAAVSTFLDDANPVDSAAAAAAAAVNPTSQSQPFQSPFEMSPSPSPSRSRSPSPPPASRSYSLRSSSKASAASQRSGIRTFADLNRNPKDDDDDSDSDPDFNPQDYYTGGEKSGMVVRDPSKANNVDAIFNQARQAGAVDASAEHLLPSSSSGSFAGTARLLSGDVPSTTTPQQPPQIVSHIITFWRNGFTVGDGPFRRLDDPLNAAFLESIKKSECPKELVPADKRSQVCISLMRKDEDYKELKKRDAPFRGVGRTLGSTSDDVITTPTEPETVPTALTTAPAPSRGLVVDETRSTTSIQLRLADGTRMVSRFNNNHTIRDIRGFIDASRPDGLKTYQLQSMGFPPKKLDDLDQTIEEAGIANSVVIQRL